MKVYSEAREMKKKLSLDNNTTNNYTKNIARIWSSNFSSDFTIVQFVVCKTLVYVALIL